MRSTITLTLTLLTLLTTNIVIATPDNTDNSNKNTILKRTPALNYIGCYSTSENLSNRTSHLYQSFGWCLTQCRKNNAATFALKGYECLCGNALPPSEDMVPKRRCGTVCPGWVEDTCGGNDLYSVYTTGLPGKDGVAVDANSASNSTSSSTSTSESTSTSTSSAETASSADNNTPASDYIADDTQNSNNNINSNTGLIVGVVIGACGGAAVVIGALFFWRWRTRKQDAQKTGVDSAGDYCGDFGHEVSRADSRFDGDHLAECRKTNGSIDDLGDYSRRILKVCMFL